MGLNSPLQHTNPTTDKYCLECKHSAVQRSVQGCTSESSHSVFVYQQVYIARGCECEREFKVFPHLPLSVSWYQLQPPHSPPTDGPVANARMEYGLERKHILDSQCQKVAVCFHTQYNYLS